jgi:hypothetical protein
MRRSYRIFEDGDTSSANPCAAAAATPSSPPPSS